MATIQQQVQEELHTKPSIDPKEEIKTRVQFLKDYLVKSNTKGYVLGISGGQDSTLAGKLAQIAVDELNAESNNSTYQFIAVRLPYGIQHDEDDANLAMEFIDPSVSKSVNIKAAVDASEAAFNEATGQEMTDFNKGNTKARERMKVQFDLAAHYGCLVIGTDHGAEAITGFFTKYGDGACDVAPLFGLNKRQGKELLKTLEAPERLYVKVPTADLEDDKPGLPDEEALGMTYDNLDDYLEGKEVEASIVEKIEARYRMTEHKRQLPVTIFDSWWR
ncbi:ammonia-dependent NAD(+) synthetase [Alkalihalophilus lindianensis]|uniref:NH(3)-dependent NAD(+) synthetase n=1 Tax=Alkalihalophilus lindianensis TaxID=1630542 RepID=A0ABU3X7S9_9BACI|nr:ammonia-dependent NAD(+) synthetase [Alkalihalophilus lindianensis]MDV2683919.1 ammonia-dependent NAD(+) synthetase [Alkalihalophilus lindianensis]